MPRHEFQIMAVHVNKKWIFNTIGVTHLKTCHRNYYCFIAMLLPCLTRTPYAGIWLIK